MNIEYLEEPIIETSNNMPDSHEKENPDELKRIRKISGQKHQFIEVIKKEEKPQAQNKIKILLQQADKYAQFLL